MVFYFRKGSKFQNFAYLEGIYKILFFILFSCIFFFEWIVIGLLVVSGLSIRGGTRYFYPSKMDFGSS